MDNGCIEEEDDVGLVERVIEARNSFNELDFFLMNDSESLNDAVEAIIEKTEYFNSQVRGDSMAPKAYARFDRPTQTVLLGVKSSFDDMDISVVLGVDSTGKHLDLRHVVGAATNAARTERYCNFAMKFKFFKEDEFEIHIVDLLIWRLLAPMATSQIDMQYLAKEKSMDALVSICDSPLELSKRLLIEMESYNLN